MGIELTYYGHSCFTLQAGDYRICVDPYKDYIPGYLPLEVEADEVCCSHGHDDHAWTAAVTLRKAESASPFEVTELQGYHDDVQGAKRGPNTMRIFEAEGVRIAHLGDIGCMPKEEQIEALKGLDACLVPVGGFYTIDAAQAKALMDLIRPRVVIPMHYRLGDAGFGEIAELSAFTSLYSNINYVDCNTITITEEEMPGVYVLNSPQMK